MPHAKPKWIASLPHAFASSCIFCGKLKNNIQYSFLSNTQHCCIELCQKSAPLCEECACTILTAMKAVHLKVIIHKNPDRNVPSGAHFYSRFCISATACRKVAYIVYTGAVLLSIATFKGTTRRA